MDYEGNDFHSNVISMMTMTVLVCIPQICMAGKFRAKDRFDFLIPGCLLKPLAQEAFLRGTLRLSLSQHADSLMNLVIPSFCIRDHNYEVGVHWFT